MCFLSDNVHVEIQNLKRTQQTWPHTVFDKIQMNFD